MGVLRGLSLGIASSYLLITPIDMRSVVCNAEIRDKLFGVLMPLENVNVQEMFESRYFY